MNVAIPGLLSRCPDATGTLTLRSPDQRSTHRPPPFSLGAADTTAGGKGKGEP